MLIPCPNPTCWAATTLNSFSCFFSINLHVSKQHAYTAVSWFLLNSYYGRWGVNSFILSSLISILLYIFGPIYCLHYCDHVVYDYSSFILNF